MSAIVEVVSCLCSKFGIQSPTAYLSHVIDNNSTRTSSSGIFFEKIVIMLCDVTLYYAVFAYVVNNFGPSTAHMPMPVVIPILFAVGVVLLVAYYSRYVFAELARGQ